MSEASTLLAVPNVSEGRNASLVEEIAAAFTAAPHARGRVLLLDVHSDPHHHRSVFTLAGPPRALADALLRGLRLAVERIDVMGGREGEEPGQHPHVGAVDVVPIVYTDAHARGDACAEALLVADRMAVELEVPVFLYGELTAEGTRPGRTRAELRRGGASGLAARLLGAEVAENRDPDAPAVVGSESERPPLVPDFGPPLMHPTAGAALVAARPPLVAFNLELSPPASRAEARAIAARIREGGDAGLPGVRAIGIELSGGRAQVSTNVERPLEVPLAAVVEAVRRLAPVSGAELVGLAPAAALEGFPEDVDIHGFDPGRQIIENALG